MSLLLSETSLKTRFMNAQAFFEEMIINLAGGERKTDSFKLQSGFKFIA